MKIGFFDSGLGGLSILKPIQKQFPRESYLYVADQANAPYHTKSEKFIIDRAHTITAWLVENNIDILVIACNTATTLAISSLRKRFSIPIIGVEPAVALAKNEHSITLLATLPTLNSTRTTQLISLHQLDSKTTKKSMPHWTEIVENGQLGHSNSIHRLKQDLETIGSNQSLIIACTHYIFMIDQIKKLRPDIKIYDPRNGIVTQVRKYVSSSTQKQPPNFTKNKQIEIYTTGEKINSKTLERLLNIQSSVKSLSI